MFNFLQDFPIFKTRQLHTKSYLKTLTFVPIVIIEAHVLYKISLETHAINRQSGSELKIKKCIFNLEFPCLCPLYADLVFCIYTLDHSV